MLNEYGAYIVVAFICYSFRGLGAALGPEAQGGREMSNTSSKKIDLMVL